MEGDTEAMDNDDHSEPTILSDDEEEEDSQTPPIHIGQDYQPRTLKPSDLTSRRRRSLLPAYPTHKYDVRPALLLFANVPNIDRDLMASLSYSGDHITMDKNLEYCPFTLQLNKQHEFIHSYLIDFYRKLYMETSQRWKIDLSLIDYNLTRLHKAMDKYSKQVGEAAIASIDELPWALEFYLQIDVDLFFLKTCDFRDAQPRLFGPKKEKEGLLCQIPPSARYGTKPCRHRKCCLCEKELNGSSAVMEFSEKQIHRFVNTYEAILNCPADCNTSNIIYVLICPCGEYDYIGSTAKSFVDRVAEHRQEGHRMIREFLIGPRNVSSILNQDKRKVEPLANKYDLLLYQHSARCQHGLQRFLNQNPSYWCFIPQSVRQVKLDNEAYMISIQKNMNNNRATTITSLSVIASQPPPPPPRSEGPRSLLTASGKPMLFAEIVADMIRTDEEAEQLARNVPEPPMGFAFSYRQKEEQKQFFQAKNENRVFPSDFVHLYNYAIVAVLPDDCSRDLRKFIEALFVTHTETKLNLIGRLTHEYPTALYDKSIRGNWCSKLIHPLFRNNNTE